MKRSIISLITTATFGISANATELMPVHSYANACNALGLDLYKSINKDGSNLCISPYSIQTALLMTHHGANGDTLQEMKKVLHIETSLGPLAKAHSDYIKSVNHRISKKIPAYMNAEKTELSVANRIFLEQHYQPKQDFLDLCKNQYNSPVETLDFKNEADQSRLHINQWVSNQTKSKINNLLGDDSINKKTSMVLTNCLYFKASWTKPFKENMTSSQPFYNTKDQSHKVPTMHMMHRFGYKKSEHFQAVTLPFGAHKNFQMLVVLPNKGIPLEQVIKDFSSTTLQEFIRLEKESIKLALPKFKIESESIALKPSLVKLGMKSAFSPRANFSNMTTKNDLYISDVVHKTFIEIDESGAEAAAATAVIMERKSARPKINNPIDFKVNRPFFFAIQDKTSGHCYFIGSIKTL